MNPTARRAAVTGTVLAGLTTLTLITAAAASAHVTVDAPGATRGGTDQTITFRVPNELPKAATTQLQISIPTDTPIASVLPQVHPGWTVTTTTVKLAKPIHTDDGDITDAVSTVTWKAKAQADGIPAGQFDEFVLIAGLLPNVESLTLPVIQTYSDGTIVKWIERPAPGSTTQPDHPAPVLKLSANTSTKSTAPATATKTGATSTTGVTVLAIVALVLAAGAIGLTLVRTARSS
jgi:uncharacterized protein